MQPEELRLAVVGHRDHGKSTLIHQLLTPGNPAPGSAAPGSLTRERPGSCGNLQSAGAAGHRHTSVSGGAGEPSHREVSENGPLPAAMPDQLSEEQSRGITLDSAQLVLRTRRRAFVLIDTPGHEDLLSNMLSGASWAEAAVVVVDALQGPQRQTRWHLEALAVLGVRALVIAVNKMDLVSADQGTFKRVAADTEAIARRAGMCVQATVPVSALMGQNVNTPTWQFDWAEHGALLSALEQLPAPDQHEKTEAPACLPVQLAFTCDGHPYALGLLETGRLAIGQTVTVLPEGHNTQVDSLYVGDRPAGQAAAGDSVAVQLDASVEVERGTVLVGEGSPLQCQRQVTVRLMQFAGRPLRSGDAVEVRGQLTLGGGRVQSVTPGDDDGTDTAVSQGCAAGDGPIANRLLWARLNLNAPMVLDTTGQHAALVRVLLSVNDHPCAVGRIECDLEQ